MKGTGERLQRNKRSFLAPRRVLPVVLAAAVSWAFLSCGRISSRIPPEVEGVVERIGQRYAPDRRVTLYEIHLHKKGDQIIVSGELIDGKLESVLLDSLRRLGARYEFVDNIRVLPGPELAPKSYGIVDVTVANIRREPKNQAELVNQAVFGTVVRLFKREKGYFYIQNWDRYLGWMSKASFQQVDSLRAGAWRTGDRLVVTAEYAKVWSRPGGKGELLARVVPTSVLLKRGREGSYYQVELPSGTLGYVAAAAVLPESQLNRIHPTREGIVKTAKSFLRVPYLWGGTSVYGFDCSGFVQTVFRLNNVSLPRDASQMVRLGTEVSPGEHFEKVLPGDLLFFGPKPDRITHVGLSLGGALFIHEDAEVHINSLDPAHPLFNEYRRKTFRKVKRILQDE